MNEMVSSISAVILTKNEEQNIVDCIDSLLFCKEIIVIDDNSQDLTAELAQKQGATVYKNKLEGDFSVQRNFGLEKAQGDWVLFIDADERVNKSLQNEILLKVEESYVDGYFLKRVDHLWNQTLTHGEVGNIKLLRLGRRKKGRWTGNVHEVWDIQGKTGQLENSLDHYPHPTLSEFLREIDFYTDIRSKELYEKGVKTHWSLIILFPLGKFFLNYIFKNGFQDKTAGLVFAILMSLHSFLVRAKLYMLWKNKNEK